MTATASNKIGVGEAPAPLRVVVTDRELMAKLAEARDSYASAIRQRRNHERALAQCERDADASMLSRRAAAAYLSGADPGEADAHDVTRARAAAAALPELKRALKSALDGEESARGTLRGALAHLARHAYDVACGEYQSSALKLGSAWMALRAAAALCERLGGAFSHEPLLPLSVDRPVCAVALTSTPRADTTDGGWGQRWLIPPDQGAPDILEAVHRRVIEREQALRELVVADDVGWPFDAQSQPPRYRDLKE